MCHRLLQDEEMNSEELSNNRVNLGSTRKRGQEPRLAQESLFGIGALFARELSSPGRNDSRPRLSFFLI